MTKGNRETRMRARAERQLIEKSTNQEKFNKQGYREERRSFNNKKKINESPEVEEREDIIVGRNAVMEVLKSDRTIEALYIANGNMEGSIKAIINIAREKGLVIKEVDRKKLDIMSNGNNHQGVIAQVTAYKYYEIADMINYAKKKNQDPFIVVLDEIEDPHNLGSIIRTAELCGVHGIVIPKRRNVGVTSTVYKCSVGAIEHMRIAKVTNINAAIDELKKEGLWIYGADIAGTEYSYEVDFGGPCAIVIGSEGRGISKLTLKKCDKLVKIPMVGRINSLNASVAGGIMMYEILKGRLSK
ncbi:Putative TrmH family tRNA/rRNA methyltransferase [Clostridium tertium]|uniref:TrmH family tRNA/rRNA methyltransferase n=2 Tax=Clostridium tertium TaxID=1559 RepID=A0A6N3CH57_9CLOT